MYMLRAKITWLFVEIVKEEECSVLPIGKSCKEGGGPLGDAGC
jgi:hypothetical protein